jgi:ankyrin repeat protein
MITEQLCNDCWNGELEAVRVTLSTNITQFLLQGYNARGQTALYCAARNNHTHIMVLLLNHKGMKLIFSFFLFIVL